jgi:Caspase domain
MIKLRIALEEQDFQITIVENPDSKGVKKAFDDFISQYAWEFNARLLVYFSEHGYTMKQQWGGEMGYIIPADAP